MAIRKSTGPKSKRARTGKDEPTVLSVNGRAEFVVVPARDFERLEADAEYARTLRMLRDRVENPGRLAPWTEAKGRMQGTAARALRRRRKSA